ncbi:hypothetical protein ACFE04_004342 [Oxalis oulophora]
MACREDKTTRIPPLCWYSSLPPPPSPVTLIDSREFFYREKHGNSASTWEDLMTMISEILSENSIGVVHTARRCNYDRIDYEYYGDSDGGSWWSRAFIVEDSTGIDEHRRRFSHI